MAAKVAYWSEILEAEQQKPYFEQVMQHVAQRRAVGHVVYPADADIFNAFRYTDFNQVKVVILGQDPYHGPGQAQGLSFSVPRGVKPPPSLANIYKELVRDIDDFVIPSHGDLHHWARQGVLLLNTVLTVEQGQAHSHANIGWQHFTDTIISSLSEKSEGIVFLLWGKHAQNKSVLIDPRRHHLLLAPHPSPLSAYRGFFGSGHFSATNKILREQGQRPIDWQV
ncbi:MAG: uracil-DNA glycosylase [Paraglaciecola sp.]|jgi:uracil-DNA glycosylase